VTIPEGVVAGDNLEILQSLPNACVDLIYIDPPFGTGKAQTMRRISTGSGDQTRVGYGGKSYNYEEISRLSYADNMPFDAYLDFLQIRLAEMHRVLAATGSLYLHLDYRTVHYARFMLDEIFGADQFLNEIIWAYDYGGRHKDRWPRKHDSILWYSKGTTWTFNRDEIDRIPYMAPGLVTVEKAQRGKLPTDVWWMTIVPTNSAERTGYPTQKPVKLIERIVRASSQPGDLVADFFCGSGTTGVAAQNADRRYLLVDHNPEAVEIAEQRLLANGHSKT
jgi:site-specific DNA-methyltransferase (adenine-specific)